MFGLGTPELVIILIVLLLLFGSRLPGIMRGLGKSVTEFKKGMNEIDEPLPASGDTKKAIEKGDMPPANPA